MALYQSPDHVAELLCGPDSPGRGVQHDLSGAGPPPLARHAAAPARPPEPLLQPPPADLQAQMLLTSHRLRPIHHASQACCLTLPFRTAEPWSATRVLRRPNSQCGDSTPGRCPGSSELVELLGAGLSNCWTRPVAPPRPATSGQWYEEGAASEPCHHCTRLLPGPHPIAGMELCSDVPLLVCPAMCMCVLLGICVQNAAFFG